MRERERESVCVCVCVRVIQRDLQTSIMRRPMPELRCLATERKMNCCAVPCGHATWSRTLKKEHTESVRVKGADENISSYERDKVKRR